MEVEDRFAALIGELSKGFSWRLITQIIIIALLGIPILKLYVYFVPQVFSLPPQTQNNLGVRYILVPSSKLWINSGVTIEPGEKISMHASGYINLAMHRLVDSARIDIPPSYHWSGPEGIEIDKNLPLYHRREDLLIEKRALPGQLLYAAVRNTEVPPSKKNPRPKRMNILSSDSYYTNRSDERETLYFTINEKLLENNQKAKLAFVGKNQEEVDETYGPGVITLQELEKQFENIVNNRYWTVWFDDNIGQFLIEIK